MSAIREAAPTEKPMARPTALVIDDNRDVATALTALCRAVGFDAAALNGGDRVERLLAERRPDCLLVDIMMPDEDGYEVLKAVAAVDPSIAVLLISGHGETWLRMGVTLGEAHGIRLVQATTKPVRIDTLRRFFAAVTAGKNSG